MRIALGKFASSAIQTRFGEDLKTAVEAALLHYARRIRSKRPPVGLPGFLRDRIPPGQDTIELDLSVPPSVEEALLKEARRQDATIDQLATHAVFIYLVDLDLPKSGERRPPAAGEPPAG